MVGASCARFRLIRDAVFFRRHFSCMEIRGDQDDMNVEKERRSGQKELSSVLKRQLNDAQLLTLRGLEGFGWELKFIRRKPFQEPIAVIFDGDRKQFAVLEADGSLNESPAFEIRS
jgi:hypothetical protein